MTKITANVKLNEVYDLQCRIHTLLANNEASLILRGIHLMHDLELLMDEDDFKNALRALEITRPKTYAEYSWAVNLSYMDFVASCGGDFN